MKDTTGLDALSTGEREKCRDRSRRTVLMYYDDDKQREGVQVGEAVGFWVGWRAPFLDYRAIRQQTANDSAILNSNNESTGKLQTVKYLNLI